MCALQLFGQDEPMLFSQNELNLNFEISAKSPQKKPPGHVTPEWSSTPEQEASNPDYS